MYIPICHAPLPLCARRMDAPIDRQTDSQPYSQTHKFTRIYLEGSWPHY